MNALYGSEFGFEASRASAEKITPSDHEPLSGVSGFRVAGALGFGF